MHGIKVANKIWLSLQLSHLKRSRTLVRYNAVSENAKFKKGVFSGQQKNFVNALMDMSSSPAHASKAKCMLSSIIKSFDL